MSAIAVWCPTDTRDEDPPVSNATVDTLLDRMSHLAGGERETSHTTHASLGCARYGWECALSHAGPTLVAQRDGCIAVADATLYYADEIERALASAGVPATSPAATDVLLAAYLAWGAQVIDRVEGDYAFAIWDNRRHQLVLGRDPIGRRPLFVRSVPGGVAAATHAAALAHTRFAGAREAPIDRDVLAAAVSGLLSGSTRSGFSGVTPIGAGTLWVWDRDAGLRQNAAWVAPPFQTTGRVDLVEGGRELLRLLQRAVSTRLAPDTTAVWMSGGTDSTAVFASACALLENRGSAGPGSADRTPQLALVSISYPQGDSAREDEYIAQVAARWRREVSWVDSESIHLFTDEEARATTRDDPYAHTFEQSNRRLSSESLQHGARVAFDGHGGDLLFQVSEVFAADLLLEGKLRDWWQVVRNPAFGGWRSAIRWGVLPRLPETVWRVIDRARGKPLARIWEQSIAEWTTPAARHRLEDLGWQRAELASRRREGAAAFESRWYLTAPYMARAVAWTHHFALQSGVEIRSPLLDRRVITFAASRPVLERASIGDSKRLLKEAMRGLVPDSVLAPRPYKTGVPRGYFHRQLSGGLAPRVQQFFGNAVRVQRTSVLADLGVVDPHAVLRGLEEYLATRDHLTGVRLFLTLQAEHWASCHCRNAG